MTIATTDWYEAVRADALLAQGDMVRSCPVSIWNRDAIASGESDGRLHEALEAAVQVVELDAIVMTQSCDLAQGRIENVILCPYTPLDEFKKQWEADQEANGRSTNAKTWKSTCNNIRNGFVWNYSLLNRPTDDDEHLIVGFHEVYTVPIKFLTTVLASRGEQRLRLVPPYREHLAQAFARHFMRVGLPEAIQL